VKLASVAEIPRFWGSNAEDRARAYPCDRFLADPADAYVRAIDVDAPPAVLFGWLCQLRAAPYSYDLIDNFGRRSPRSLSPGLERLELGQRFMTIFDLVDFEPDRHVTLAIRRWRAIFGEGVVTYWVEPRDDARSRLAVKLLIGGRLRAPRRQLMPWLDGVMMRKQLLNLRDLAERDTVS
jgi:hypothetical protein